jgi:hypothetical protein
MTQHFPMTITMNSAAVTIMATENGLYVKCTDHLMPEKGLGQAARDLEDAYRIAAEQLKERLKAHVDADVEHTIHYHRSVA